MLSNEQLDYLAAQIARLLKPAHRRNHKTPAKLAPIERVAYSIPEFCAVVGISRGSYYLMKKAGTAPASAKVGRARVVISKEAADQWLKDRGK